MWLPDQEGRAVQAVRLLLSLGADPMLRNRDGDSAADIARRRGLEEVADLLDAAGVAPLAPDGWFGPFEKLAHEFRTAYLTGDTDAMASVAEFAGQSLPLAEFRTAVHARMGVEPDRLLDLSLEDAQRLIARHFEFESWEAFRDCTPAKRARHST